MESKQYTVTIEICSSKIVGIVGEKTPSGAVSVDYIETVEISPERVCRGIVQNVEETKYHVANIIKRLESHISPRTISGVYVGVSGRSLHNIPVEITEELDPNQSISEDVINNIIHKCQTSAVEGDVLAVEPRIYVLDGKQETSNPIGSYSSRITANMNLIVAKPTLMMNLRRVFESMKVLGYIITPLAVADKILSNDERQLGCMLVDFGAETTTVSIYKNDALQYLATLPMGSRLITRDITNVNVTENNAESLKRTIGNAMGIDVKDMPTINGISTKDISNYVEARVGEIRANIVEQLTYAKMTSDDIAAGGVILIGGGSRLNGFGGFIEDMLKVKVMKGHHSPYVNIVTHDAENFEYIQSVALVETAAKMMKYNENCVFTPKPPAPVEPPVTDEEAKPEVRNERRREPKPHKPNIFGKWLDKAKTIFNDTDEDEDDGFSGDDKSANY